MWKFGLISQIEEQKFDTLLEKFVSYGVNGLVRENIQNSLDAKLEIIQGPVIVKIKIGMMNKIDIPGLENIVERINCLTGGNDYTRGTIKHMKQFIEIQDIPYVSFEDENTKGLSQENWDYYAYQKGAHFRESDNEKESIRGGSHGVGKIASNSASDLHMMFFANCDESNNKQLGGTVQLIEHKYNGSAYRSTGYFTDEKKESNKDKFVPYINNYGKIFEKNTRGLKIVIPFLKEQFNNEKMFINAVCDNFFIAIMKEKLIVYVNDTVIDSKTMNDIVNNKLYYEENKDLTPLYIETYSKVQPMDLEILDKNKEIYKFKLYFRIDDNIFKGRVAIVRRIGMKIEDFTVKNHSKYSFNAILIPQSKKEDIFLKSLENESHTKLTSDTIRDVEEQNNAKRFINNISRELGSIITETIKKDNENISKLETDDLIYSVEHKFKEQFMKDTSTVSVTPEGKKIKKLLIKKDINKNNVNIETSDAPDRTNKSSIRNREKKGKYDVEKKLYSHKLEHNQVKRIIFNNEEKLLLDIKQDKNFRNQNKCNIYLELIDGQGHTSNEKLNLKEYYNNINDSSQSKEYEIKESKILNVDINGGVVSLHANINEKSNTSLKFVYIVEVEI